MIWLVEWLQAAAVAAAAAGCLWEAMTLHQHAAEHQVTLLLGS